MEITVAQEGGVYVATLRGVLDEESHALFEQLLHPLVVQRGNRVVLDLSGVPRTTSMGLSELVTLAARANTKGASVVLAAPSPFVRSVLGVTRLDTFFALADTVEQSLRAGA
jgi:anti-sigma B factor antagonist